LVRWSSTSNSLFSAHNTWSTYTAMLRVYKHYDFSFHQESGMVAGGSSFSSFPGNLASGDDFYVTSANLVVMETTLDVMNLTLYYQHVTVNTVMYWIRVTVANRMATTGQQWSQIFGLYNSGTYNNQWIVVDNKLFTSSKSRDYSKLAPGTLWIAEQIPGYVVSADQTAVLANSGYWASYNIPFYPFIYNISDYPAYFKKFGNDWSYAMCARAQIFRRDQSSVNTLQDMKRIMRYNQYQTDPLSLQDACRQIAARCDLNPPWANNPLNSYSAFGAIDAKITDDRLSPSRTVLAVSGPTWDSQCPFAWTQQWSDVPHFGQPTIFNFDFVQMAPMF